MCCLLLLGIGNFTTYRILKASRQTELKTKKSLISQYAFFPHSYKIRGQRKKVKKKSQTKRTEKPAQTQLNHKSTQCLFLSLTPQGTRSNCVHRQRSILGISRTFLPPLSLLLNQAATLKEGTLLGGMEGEETGKRDVQPGLLSLPLDRQTSTRVRFFYIRKNAMKTSAKCSSVTSSSWNFC